MLSKLELERLKEILFQIHAVIDADEEGITWDLEPLVEEGLLMIMGELNEG